MCKSNIHPKTAFLNNISIVVLKCVNDTIQKALFMGQKFAQIRYHQQIPGILFVCSEAGSSILYRARLEANSNDTCFIPMVITG